MSLPRYLVWLFVIAFGLRFGLTLWLRDIHLPPQGIATADDVEFHRLALNLANGEGFVKLDGRPTAFRSPGFPFFLAGLFWLFGPHPEVVYVVLSLLGAYSCVLTYQVSRRLFADPWARWAGWLAAVYLGHMYFSVNFVSENLFVPLLGIGMLLFLRYLSNAAQLSGWMILTGSGLALGYATLTRPFALLLLPILGLMVLVLGHGGRVKKFGHGLLFAVAFLLMVLPWTYRNYRLFGHPILVATNGGSTFYGGNNERVVTEPKYYGYWLSTTELPGRDRIDAAPNEWAHDQVEWQLGKTWLRENPGRIPWLLGLKFARMWWLPEFDGGSRWYYRLRLASHLPIVLLFFVGAWQVARHRVYWTAAWCVLHGVMIATILTCLIFWGCSRFRDASLPALMAYAVAAFPAARLRVAE